MIRKSAKSSVVVCVTNQYDCSRLIQSGRKIADEKGLTLHVLSVSPVKTVVKERCEELEFLREITQESHAEMTVHYHDEPKLIAASFIKEVGAAVIVTGMPGVESNGFITFLRCIFPDIIISMVSPAGEIFNMIRSKRPVVTRTVAAF